MDQNASPAPRFATTVIHAGHDINDWDMNQVVPPISLSTTYKQEIPGKAKGHAYGRSGNPTRDILQRSLAALEGAEHGHVFSSGVAACAAVVNLLQSGDHIVCSNDIYGGTQRFLSRVSARHHGLQVDFVDLCDMDALQRSFRDNTKMVFIETPSNPLLKVSDIQEIVSIVRQRDEKIYIVVDNTFMTPYFQKPLALGADIVVHSLTKYINGHSDVIMGAAVTNKEDIYQHLKFQQTAMGSIPSPFDCYLVCRGMKTLQLRMQRHYENALTLAAFLEIHDGVEKVLYPALSSHPQHETHKRQTSGMSGMISFYLRGDGEQTKNFLGALKVFTVAESLGGVESLAGLPAAMSHASVPVEERLRLGITDNLVRLSVGIEDIDDIIADVDQALKTAVGDYVHID